VRIIIECPESILHLEAGYICADCPSLTLQSSCSPAADHTFRQSAVVPVALWNKSAQVWHELDDGMSNKSWPLVPFFAQCKHDGQKESRQRSEACFGN
jgi:hypothetical protein